MHGRRPGVSKRLDNPSLQGHIASNMPQINSWIFGYFYRRPPKNGILDSLPDGTRAAPGPATRRSSPRTDEPLLPGPLNPMEANQPSIGSLRFGTVRVRIGRALSCLPSNSYNYWIKIAISQSWFLVDICGKMVTMTDHVRLASCREMAAAAGF